MAVNKSVKAASEVASDADQEVPIKVKAKFEVMLANGAKRYAYKGMVYESGFKYGVDEAKRKELFDRTDDNGVRYFYDAAVVEASVKKAIKSRRGNLAGMDVSPEQYARIRAEVLNEQEEDTPVREVRESGEFDTAKGKGKLGDVGGDVDV